MASEKRMFLVVDADGRIVAAAHKAEGPSKEMNVGLAPLSNQKLYEVAVPEELSRLRSGHDFHLALTHAKFDNASGRLTFPKLTFKKLEHR